MRNVRGRETIFFLREQAMKNCTKFLFVATLVLTFVFVATAETPLSFRYKTIKVKGAQSTAIFGVNNAGVMVGSYVDSGGVRHGFRLSRGKVSTIDDSKGMDTYCFAIDKAGTIVGYYVTSTVAVEKALQQNVFPLQTSLGRFVFFLFG
jgi:hypothetical protein